MLICLIIYLMIFHYIRSSTHRIQPHSQSTQTNGTHIPRPKISRRDAHLLRHMVFILILFVIGWGFINILNVVTSYTRFNANLTTIAVLFSEISSLSIIFDLFLYNHGLRQYLRDKLMPCFGRPQH